MPHLEREPDVAILHRQANALHVDMTRPKGPGAPKIDFDLVGAFEHLLHAPERQEQVGCDGVGEEHTSEDEGHGPHPAPGSGARAKCSHNPDTPSRMKRSTARCVPLARVPGGARPLFGPALRM